MTESPCGSPDKLSCEYLNNPMAIETAKPRFAWLIDDPRDGAVQSAYQITVSRDGDVVWDSGKVISDQCNHIVYEGQPLDPRTRYTWQVRTWDGNDQPSPPSAAAWFETGHFGNDGWQAAQWIGPVDDDKPDDPYAWTQCPVLRKTFSMPANITKARLYITAKGIYDATLNGEPITEDVLSPGFTHFEKRIHYRAYDVTPLLAEGDNSLNVTLGNGWYCSMVGNWAGRDRCNYAHRPRLLALLIVTDAQGNEQTVATDDSWQMTLDGPHVQGDIYDGETYDARREGFADATWTKPFAEPVDNTPLIAHPATPVRRIRELKPIAQTEPTPGTHIFDLGQNMVGWARLKVDAPAGTAVTLRFGEMLEADGTLYTENLRDAKATDHYTCAGTKGETWEPRLTFHGFRYVEVTGLPYKPDMDAIIGVVTHNDMALTGEFECSHELLNQLQSNIEWGQRGNFLEVPTDCPQRNERQGWTGDAQIFAATACFNMDVAAFFTKWMNDVNDTQHDNGNFPYVAPTTGSGNGCAGWSDAGVIVPWTVYERYGDVRILETCYPHIKRFIDYCETDSDNLIRPYLGYGDWLSIEALTPLDLISTAFFAHSTDLAQRMANVIGQTDDAKAYGQLLTRIKEAFNNRFVTPDGRIVGDTQSSYLLALHFDLLPEDKKPAAVERLVWDIEEGRHGVWPYAMRKGHLSTGFLGVRDLPFVLSNFGHTDVAYKLLLNETYPSWLFPVKNGATTIWERWNSWTPEGFGDVRMNSFNHYAYGAVGQWMYERMAGLAPHPDEPGYKRAVIRPLLPPADSGLTFARAAIDSINGRYETAWRIKGDLFTLDVSIPANGGAEVTLPDGAVHEAAAGKHVYEVKLG